MSTGDILKELAAMRAHFELRFDQIKIDMKVEASQLKAEMKEEMHRRMDDLTRIVVERGGQVQQDPIDGGDGGQANQEQVDGAINNAGDEGQDGQEDDDHQDSVSVKSEIDSGSCQSDCDYGMNEDIVVKEEVVDEDSGIGGQQQQEQAPIEPVAGPSGISRTALKRLQANPPRRSTRQAANKHLNLAESSDTSDSDEEDETDSPSSPPPTKKARTTTTSKGHKARPCPECSKMVTNLSQHLRTHTGERPFICQQANCGGAFTQKNSLDEHLRRHRGERSHRCEQCGMRFITSTEVVKHRSRVHSQERPYRCPHSECDYASSSKFNLERHLQSNKHQQTH